MFSSFNRFINAQKGISAEKLGCSNKSKLITGLAKNSWGNSCASCSKTFLGVLGFIVTPARITSSSLDANSVNNSGSALEFLATNRANFVFCLARILNVSGIVFSSVACCSGVKCIFDSPYYTDLITVERNP